MLLIAVQAYAFSVVAPSQRTRAAAVQVLGYNGGLIVGTGLGALPAVFNAENHAMFSCAEVAAAPCPSTRFVLQPPFSRTARPPAVSPGAPPYLVLASDLRPVRGALGQ